MLLFKLQSRSVTDVPH